ncbi:MAG: ABC transporter ATP-binding protein, partial [Candidatus Zixiibacteriota bacterium]
FRNVSFSCDQRPIIKNVSLKVNDSESLVIMGPSGSGKSTILRLILGLECPQQGDIFIEGQNICYLKEKQKRVIRKKIGMLFQDGALFDSLSVWENVGYYLLEHTDMPIDTIGQKAIEMLGFVGLDAEEIVNKLPEHLSGGMQRRVAIARSLLSTEPKIMLYDEPTTGLDPQATANVLDLIMKLNEEKSISTIVVTHQIVDAITIADRFIVFIEGEIEFEGTLDELNNSRNINVLEFLAPFRASFAEVAKRKFVETKFLK